MGLLARINESFEGTDDKYERSANATLERTRKYIHGKYGDDRDIVRPKEAEELKFHIKAVNEQGGLDMHKYAMARWQIFKALYPEWITEADKPKLVKKFWKDIPDADPES